MRSLLVWLILGGLIIALIVLLIHILLPFIVPFLWASIIAMITWPLRQRICQRIHRKGLASLLTSFFVLVFLLLPMLYIVGIGIHQLVDLIPKAQVYLQQPDWWEKLKEHPTLKPMVHFMRSMAERFGFQPEDIFQKTFSFGSRFATAFFKNSLLFFFRLIFVILFLYLLYYHGDAIVKAIVYLIPLPEDRLAQLTQLVSDMMKAIFFGIFFTALIQGLLGGIGFAIAGLPSPVVFGLLMAFFALFPVGGAAIIWIPAGFILLLTGEVGKGIFIWIWGFLAVSSLDNFIRPLLIAGKTHFPLILVFIGALGGVMAFGLLGIFLGPLVLSLTAQLLVFIRQTLHPELARTVLK